MNSTLRSAIRRSRTTGSGDRNYLVHDGGNKAPIQNERKAYIISILNFEFRVRAAYPLLSGTSCPAIYFVLAEERILYIRQTVNLS